LEESVDFVEMAGSAGSGGEFVDTEFDCAGCIGVLSAAARGWRRGTGGSRRGGWGRDFGAGVFDGGG
jgi:hypothetical protein